MIFDDSPEVRDNPFWAVFIPILTAIIGTAGVITVAAVNAKQQEANRKTQERITQQQIAAQQAGIVAAAAQSGQESEDATKKLLLIGATAIGALLMLKN